MVRPLSTIPSYDLHRVAKSASRESRRERQKNSRRQFQRDLKDHKTWRMTEEEKTLWGPLIVLTWRQIQPDCQELGDLSVEALAEMCLDANRMSMFAGLTAEEENVLCGNYFGSRGIPQDPKIVEWVHGLLKDYAD